jgi:hypothetical protein
MQTEFMLLAIYNKPRLNLKEVCEAIGMSMKTAYNQRSANAFRFRCREIPCTLTFAT